MKKAMVMIALILSVMLMATSSFASFACTGKVKMVAVGWSGDVSAWMDYRQSWVLLCNLHNEMGGVKTETCKKWHDDASVAMVTGKSFQAGYGNNVTGYTCTNLPTWGADYIPSWTILYSN